MQASLIAQSIPTEIHYHHGWLVLLLFLMGEAMHIALQVNDLAQKSKQSRRVVLEQIGIKVLFRAFACTMVFILIWQDPAIIAQIAKIFGANVSGDESSVLALPMNNAIAGLYGLFLDSALGYIPLLKSQLPQVDVPIQSALADAATANVAAGAAIATAQIKATGTGDGTTKP